MAAGTPLAQAFVRIRPETAGFQREATAGISKAGRGIAQQGGKHGRLFGATFARATVGPFRSIIGLVGGPLLAGFATLAGVRVFASFIAEAREAGRVTRLTENVIRSTGGAAKVTAGQVAALADRLSNATAIDDELIQSTSNLLLTFKNVRNELGKGNQIFDRATAAALDLSAQGFGSVDSAAKMLGKALNDPIRGMGKLEKAGVGFTDQQKKQVKILVEAGDVLSAQRIILQEVESQVGGAAKAAADPMQRLSVVVNNLKERLGVALLPALTAVAIFIADKLVPALSTAADLFKANIVPAVKGMVAAFKKGEGSAAGLAGFFEDLGVAARVAFNFFKSDVLPALQSFGRFVQTTVVPATLAFRDTLADLGGFFSRHTGLLKGLIIAIAATVVVTKAHTAAMAIQAAGGFTKWLVGYLQSIKLVQVATKVWTAFQWLLNVALTANPIGIVIVAIAAFVAGIVLAYRNSETFRNIVTGAFNAVSEVIQAVFNWVKNNWPLILAILTGPVGLAVRFIIQHWEQIKATFAAGVRAVVGFLKGLPGQAVSALASLGRSLLNVGLTAMKQLFEGHRQAWGALYKWLRGLPRLIVGALGNLGSLLFNAGRQIIQGLINGVKSLAGSVGGAIKDAVSSGINAAKSALGIGSPSKVFKQIGEDTLRGYTAGIRSMQSTAGRAVANALSVTPVSAAARPASMIAAPAAGHRLDELMFVSALRRALDGMSWAVTIDDRGNGRMTARMADLLARAG